VVSRFHRHGLGIQNIVVEIFQFTSQDLDIARRGQTQGHSVARNALHDDFDRLANQNALADSTA
jgi:hypothetical protein